MNLQNNKIDNEIIEYICKQSVEYIKNNNFINIEDIKVIVLSEQFEVYSKYLQEFNIASINMPNSDFLVNNINTNNSYDLVLGNPLDKRQEKLKSIKPLLLNYKSYFETADLNVYLFEKGFRLLNEGGVLSYYTNSKYTKARYAKNFRSFILNNVNILEYMDFNDKSIFTYQKSEEKSFDFTYCQITNKCKNIRDFTHKNSYNYLLNDLNSVEFKFLSLKQIEIKHKIEKMGLLDMISFLNYRLVNFYKSIINFESVDTLKSLTIPKEQEKIFEILVEYILFAKENNLNNEASLFESVINGLVYDLYFEEEMKKGDCFITDEVTKVVTVFDGTLDMIRDMYKVFRENNFIQGGIIYSRVIGVVKVINGDMK